MRFFLDSGMQSYGRKIGAELTRKLMLSNRGNRGFVENESERQTTRGALDRREESGSRESFPLFIVSDMLQQLVKRGNHTIPIWGSCEVQSYHKQSNCPPFPPLLIGYLFLTVFHQRQVLSYKRLGSMPSP
jgi:hypothetical protein